MQQSNNSTIKQLGNSTYFKCIINLSIIFVGICRTLPHSLSSKIVNMSNLSCAKGTLKPYIPSSAQPWNELRIKHLYRRLSFGASPNEIIQALERTPSDLVETLLHNAMEQPLSPVPAWKDFDYTDYEKIKDEEERDEKINNDIFDWIKEWIQDMLKHGVRGKFILFWHNHFVTQLETYYFPRYLYDYHHLLQSKALGNFKDFVHQMGKNTAMLLFLNGVESTKEEPNENYARELYELFTLGRDQGYTQKDIEETARALTGWNGLDVFGQPIAFVNYYHDKGEKTIFEQTGNWNYDDVTNILFQERATAIAQFICTKIYTTFVNPRPDLAIIHQLANTLLTHNWEMAPVLNQLFKSEHFFDAANIGLQIKSPYELFFNFFKAVNYEASADILDSIHYFTSMLGQELAMPIDVAGWRGNRTWIDTARITGRWRVLSWTIYDLMDNQPEKLTQLAHQLTGNAQTNDPALVTQKVVDFFLAKALHTPEIYERATIAFKVDIPQNYFDDGSWNLHWDTIPWQMTALLQYLIKLPEFQLT
jgi:uncharacterized protein (DUF1800 family)